MRASNPPGRATEFDPAVLPGALRRGAAWLAPLCAATVVTIGLRYEGLTESTRIDRVLHWAVDNWIPEKERSFWLIQFLGNPPQVVALAAILAVLALVAGRPRIAVLAVLGPGLTGVATTAGKLAFDRTLDGTPSYPSGHTAAFTALALVAALLLVSLLRAGAGTKALMVCVVALGAGFAMAVALTSLGIHYPTDTIGGFATAVAMVLAAALLIDASADRLAVRRARG